MLDVQLPLFLIVFVLWIGGRFLLTHWLWGAVASGRISNRVGQIAYAATLAVLPVLALPWVPWAWPYLLAAAVALFLIQLAFSGAYLAFLRRNT
jgi:hypothetical protein